MSEAFDIDAVQRRLEATVEQSLVLAKQFGATACEVDASASQGLEVCVRMGDVDTVSQSRDQQIQVTVYRGQRKGSASTMDTRDAALRATVEKACDIARFTGEDPASGLADAALMAQDRPDLALYHPWAITAEEAIALATRCERAGLAIEGIDNSEGATVATSRNVHVYGNSHGFIGSERRSSHSMSCVLIAKRDETMQRDYEYSSVRDPQQLTDPEEIGRKAAEKALARLGGQRPPTGQYPIVFAPNMARTLVAHFLGAIAGGALYRDASFLCDAVGQTLFPDWFSLGERPREPGALASASFDAEGVYTRDNCFVEYGVLKQYLLSSYSARRLGLACTGNAGGARNLRIDAPLTPKASLFDGIENGILVTELMGQGVNTVTGDYSRGAAGFWIENGQITHPIENFTLAGNLRTMFQNLEAIGDDIDRRGNLHTGSWHISRMTVAS